ncbi:MAG: DUF2946 domain-containing protein [Psychrobium sp.]|nr:DUF2946 domain-containing protein [Psychrobium sp.]
MKNSWLSLLIVLSIALQSFAAIASPSETHQIDSQHIQTLHSHELDSIELFEKTSSDEHSIKDCHHCGHCSGTHGHWLTSDKHPEIFVTTLFSNQYFYIERHAKSVIEPFVRPPIS